MRTVPLILILSVLTIGSAARAEATAELAPVMDAITNGDLGGASDRLNHIFEESGPDQRAAVAHLLLAGARPESAWETPEDMLASVNYVMAVQSPERGEFALEQARRFLDAALQGGSDDAIMIYAFMYSGDSVLVARDVELYRRWLDRGSSAGIAEAADLLAELDEYESRLASGDAETLFNTGKELMYSRDAADLQRGVEMIAQAADLYHMPAIHYVGQALLMERRGDSAKDFAPALRYFEMGAAVGDTLSTYYVEDIQACLEDGSTCAEL